MAIKKCKTKNVQTRYPTKSVQMNPQIKGLQFNANELHWLLQRSRPTRRPNSSGNDRLQSWFSAGWMFGISTKLPSKFQYRQFTSSGSPVQSQSFTGCTFNFYSKYVSEKSEAQKKRRAYIIESDDED